MEYILSTCIYQKTCLFHFHSRGYSDGYWISGGQCVPSTWGCHSTVSRPLQFLLKTPLCVSVALLEAMRFTSFWLLYRSPVSISSSSTTTRSGYGLLCIYPAGDLWNFLHLWIVVQTFGTFLVVIFSKLLLRSHIYNYRDIMYYIHLCPPCIFFSFMLYFGYCWLTHFQATYCVFCFSQSLFNPSNCFLSNSVV